MTIRKIEKTENAIAFARRIAADRVLTLLANCLVVIASIAAALTYFNPPFTSYATNSDTLLASAWAHLVLEVGLPFASFQLPQTPSLFPDLVVHGFLQIATGSWRLASLIYGCLQFLALVSAAALIIRQMAGGSRSLGAAVFTALALLLIGLEGPGGQGAFTRTRIIVEIVAHGGAFVLTLFCAACCFRMLTCKTGWPTRIIVAGLTAIAYFSDQLTIFEFDLPLAAVLIWLWRDIYRPSARNVLLAVAFGMIVGQTALWFVNREWGMHVGDPRRLLTDTTLFAAFGWWLPAIVVFAIGLIPNRVASHVQFDFTALPAKFYWRLGLAATTLTLAAVALLLYLDSGGFRYLYTLAWWPVILASAPIAASLRRFQWAAVALAGGAALVQYSYIYRTPSILTWTSPLVDCLLDHRAAYGLTSGLAEYWQARSSEASSDWRLPMVQVTSNGAIYAWGNDLTRDRAELSRANFIIMKDLQPNEIARTFGAPERVLKCPDSQIWVYGQGVIGKGAKRRAQR